MAAISPYPSSSIGELSTGLYVSDFADVQRVAARARAEGHPVDVVELSGPPAAVELLADRARLGAAELERRRARRRQQAESRRRNRPR